MKQRLNAFPASVKFAVFGLVVVLGIVAFGTLFNWVTSPKPLDRAAMARESAQAQAANRKGSEERVAAEKAAEERAKPCREFLRKVEGAGVERDLPNNRVFVDLRFQSLNFREREGLAKGLTCDGQLTEFDLLDSQTGHRIAHYADGKLNAD
jgi:hypothetical protein